MTNNLIFFLLDSWVKCVVVFHNPYLHPSLKLLKLQLNFQHRFSLKHSYMRKKRLISLYFMSIYFKLTYELMYSILYF